MKQSKLLNLVLILIIIFGIVIRFDIKDRPIRYDQGEFSYTANLMDNHGYKYLDVVNNKPPGAYYLYIIFFKLFGNEISTLYLTTIISDILVILLIFSISNHLFNKRVALLSAAIYSVLYLTFNFSWSGFLEIPMMVFTLFSVYLYLVALKKNSIILFFFSGILIGISFLIKQPGIIIFLTYLAYLFFLVFYKRMKLILGLKYFVSLFAGLLFIISLLFIYLIKLEIFSKFIYMVFYVSTTYGPSFSYKINLILNILFAALPFFVVLSLICLIKIAKELDMRRLFLVLWFTPIVLFFIITKDFQPHYLIQLIPVLTIIISSVTYKIKPKTLLRNILSILIIIFFTYNIFLISVDIYEHHINNKHYIDTGFLNNKYMLAYEQDTWVNLDMQIKVVDFLLENIDEDDKIISTNPTYAYLINKTNNYRFAWVSPMTMKLSNNLQDFNLYASQSKFLIYDSWEEYNLNKANKFLDCVKKNWHKEDISNQYIIIYRNTNKTACVS